MYAYERKQEYNDGDAVWINNTKLIKELRSKVGKKFNFFGRINGYIPSTDSYRVEFKTMDNQFETFVIKAKDLSLPSQFSKQTINNIMLHYDLDSILDYVDYAKNKKSIGKYRHKNQDILMGVNPADVNMKDYEHQEDV